MHNDILPLVFAAGGIVIAFWTRRFPLSGAAAFGLQAVPLAGLFLTYVFC